MFLEIHLKELPNSLIIGLKSEHMTDLLNNISLDLTCMEKARKAFEITHEPRGSVDIEISHRVG